MSNPKDIQGSTKPNLSRLPLRPLLETVAALEEGAVKYGPWNWRNEKVRETIYADAAIRHLMQFLSREDIDPESGMHHVVKAIAGLLILRDAQVHGCSIDDRVVDQDLGIAEIRDKIKSIHQKASPGVPVSSDEAVDNFFAQHAIGEAGDDVDDYDEYDDEDDYYDEVTDPCISVPFNDTLKNFMRGKPLEFVCLLADSRFATLISGPDGMIVYRTSSPESFFPLDEVICVYVPLESDYFDLPSGQVLRCKFTDKVINTLFSHTLNVPCELVNGDSACIKCDSTNTVKVQHCTSPSWFLTKEQVKIEVSRDDQLDLRYVFLTHRFVKNNNLFDSVLPRQSYLDAFYGIHFVKDGRETVGQLRDGTRVKVWYDQNRKLFIAQGRSSYGEYDEDSITEQFQSSYAREATDLVKILI